MDVYQVLIQDHRTIAKMFEEISGTSNKDPERRKQLFSDPWTALEDHETTEENDFLPVLVEASSFSSDAGVTATIKELVAELFDDHSDFEATFQQISKLSPNNDEWLERVNRLGSLVREHAHKEEDKLSPRREGNLIKPGRRKSDDKSEAGAGRGPDHVEDARKLGRRILTDTKFLAAVRIASLNPIAAILRRSRAHRQPARR